MSRKKSQKNLKKGNEKKDTLLNNQKTKEASSKKNETSSSSGVGGSGSSSSSSPSVSPPISAASSERELIGNKMSNSNSKGNGNGNGKQGSKKSQNQQIAKKIVNEEEDEDTEGLCPCCGEVYDYSSTDDDNYLSDDSQVLSKLKLSAKNIKGRDRLDVLLSHNNKIRGFLHTNLYYKEILDIQKGIKEQQISLMRRANTLNTMFVKNLELIIRLGICPMTLQNKTDYISDGLLEIHRYVQSWDLTLEQRIPTSPLSDQKTAVPSLANIFRDKFGLDIDSMTDEEFDKAMKKCIQSIPRLIPNEADLKVLVSKLELDELEEEWDDFEAEMEEQLVLYEIEIIELCVGYGIRVRLPHVEGYEWAHAVGSENTKRGRSRQRASGNK